MRRVAIYVRVSTLEQAVNGYSVSEQESNLRDYAQAHGWEIFEVYADLGISGAKFERPALQRMIRDAKARKFDTVLIWKYDRIARSVKDTLILVENIFAPNDIGLVSLELSLDTSTPDGMFMLIQYAAIGQLERSKISDRMAMGRHGRAKSGKPSGWSRPIFGYIYEGDTLSIDPVTGPIVQEIFAGYLSGLPLNQVTERLNAAGHIGKKQPWHHTVVRRLLLNKKYAGFTRYRDSYYPGNFEPLVSLEDWEKTQSELERRQNEAYSKFNISRPFQSKYLLSGLLYCGYCSSRFTIALGSRRKDGTRLHRYRCHNLVKGDKTCPAQSSYKADEMEEEVLAQIEQLRLDPSGLDDLSNNSEGLRREIDALNKKIEDMDQKLARLVDLYVDGTLPMESLNVKKAALDSERSAYLDKVERLSSRLKADAGVVEARDILASLTSDIRLEDFETQKQVVHALIEKIIIKGDEMAIRWRFA